MSPLPVIKIFFKKLLLKLLPRLAKGMSRSALGENKGEVCAYRQDGQKNVICMVHGFNGKARETFFKLPDLVLHDKELNGWDVISIGYASDAMPTIPLGLWAEQPDITKISGYLRTMMGTLLKNYERIAFVAHSMGGLVVQRALLDLDEDSSRRIYHLLLYGTPSAGLHKATMGRWYNIQVRDMDKDGEFVNRLRQDWKEKFTEVLPFTFITVAGELDQFVPEQSSLFPFDKQHYAYTIGNHVDMVKPDLLTHPSYQILRHALIKKQPYLHVFNDEQLNSALGDYAQLIRQLKNRINEIDKRTFIDYIFALEALNSIDAATAALQNSDHLQQSTDYMGILGGRFKRKYLAGHMQADLQKAIDWYEKAYKLSVDRTDKEQIFFHAINLAFLQLFGLKNYAAMRTYAQIAHDAAHISSNVSYWKDATIAEANLYLSNFTDAVSSCKLAIFKSGVDKRAMSSMYLNAFNACKALERNDWALEIESLFSDYL